MAVLGTCPKCGGDIVGGKFGPYCTAQPKCGFQVSRAFGKELTDEQVEKLLDGKKILLKGLVSKKGNEYDMYVKPDGVEEYTYTKKDGTDVTAYRYKFETSFPERKEKSGKKDNSGDADVSSSGAGEEDDEDIKVDFGFTDSDDDGELPFE